jgi:hypothetical protein
MVTDPICKEEGTTRGAGPRDPSSWAALSGKLSSEAADAELSQNFRTFVFYLHFVLIRLRCASISAEVRKIWRKYAQSFLRSISAPS